MPGFLHHSGTLVTLSLIALHLSNHTCPVVTGKHDLSKNLPSTILHNHFLYSHIIYHLQYSGKVGHCAVEQIPPSPSERRLTSLKKFHTRSLLMRYFSAWVAESVSDHFYQNTPKNTIGKRNSWHVSEHLHKPRVCHCRLSKSQNFPK